MAEQQADSPGPVAMAGPGAAARDEAARQLVALAGGVVFVVVAVAVERAATDPDAFRTARMRAARAVERAAMAVARCAASVADQADRVYRGDCA